MEAAIDLLFEKGFAGMTIAQVAHRAGASQGAITHHYGNKESLVLAAAEYIVDRERERLPGRLPTPVDRQQAIDAYFDASEQFFLNKRFVALLELFLAARRNPRISAVFYPLIADHRALFDTTWSDILARAGMEAGDVHQLIRMTNSMLRGLSLQLTRQKDDKLTAEIKAQCVLFRETFHSLFD